ncbi:Uu.00g099600.m01.CDS01 [Anthostomella pinea]|uniref:Uu.00g099600.m01.CDS01 n=1 Tax=Anthostomella pinea TaxID=933095 RepID=A0AAI8VCX1_9PEZI|nr:Uu.00g099600.m01.CDS01 [Anthostomella pinea]
MATAPVTSAAKKLSFASVAASNPKENVPFVLPSRVAVPAIDRRMQPTATPARTVSTSQGATTVVMAGESPVVKTSLSSSKESAGTIPPTSEATDSGNVVQGVKDTNASSTMASAVSMPSLVVNGSSSSTGGSQSKNDNGISMSDSNSEMGTKAPSLDGKSITSGTTFALDEKESLRPDDSASVKAAADDDEAFSIRGSMIANSRMGSDVARVHRLRLGDMPERRIVQVPLLPGSQEQGVGTPQSVASSQPPPLEQPQPLGPVSGPSDAFASSYGQNPDEKLLEAMQSPKDRIFLLRLEQDVINFVQSSKEPYMDLPPNNSFCRMLTHKLADYYHMTHSFEAVQGAVRIYRTPFCRVPPSLASIVESNATVSTTTPPPVVLPKKIMRRGEDDGSGQASNSASKATSEVGSDGKERSGHKEKMTREEREEAYNRARERIFGNSEKISETTPDTEDANGISRASSVSAKDKSNTGKRGKTGKQRRDDSESFESRSVYRPYFPHQKSMEWAPQFMPGGNLQYNDQLQHQPYPYASDQAYPPPPQAYPAMLPNNGFQQYGSMPAYPPQTQPIPHHYALPTGAPGASYGPPAQSTGQQPWPPSFSQAPSPGPGQSRGPPPAHGAIGPGIPYAFGQLPAHVNPSDPKSQHPIPGSYSRQPFNPKTQSFVPGSGVSPVQPPMPQYNAGGSHGSPQVGSPHLAYNSYGSPAPPQMYMGSSAYGMSRQSSSNSMSAYHAPQHHAQQHHAQHSSAHLQHLPQMPNKQGMLHQGPLAGPGQAYSHLPNYGNPATLPQKPPSGI